MNNTGFFGQIRTTFGVCGRNYIHEHRWSVLISAILMPLLIITVTGSDVFAKYAATKKGAFAFICACIWIGLFNSIQNICKERAIVAHEYREGMNLFAYISAQMLFETIICFLEAIIVSLIILLRYAGNLNNILAAPGIFLTFFLIIECSDSLGILVSSLVRRPDQAMTVMPFVLIIQLIFAGLIFELEGISETISYFTVSKWGLDAIMRISNVESMFATIFGGSSSDPSPFPICWLMMLLFTFANVILSGLLLHLVAFDKR